MLYADNPSRPNVPVNLLVAFEFLKAASGWSDEEAYNHFCFDMQVRYAVGLRDWEEGYFDLRTVYYFRRRLAGHMQETGENLLEQAFAQVTDEQLRAFSIRTGIQRVDSTSWRATSARWRRMQLLVTVLQRVYRMLSEPDKRRYAEVFAAYLQGHVGQYVYRLKREELAEHLQRIGAVMQRLLVEFAPEYSEHPTYLVLARVFAEHFRLERERVEAKRGEELSGTCLQSPDDLEATYRKKGGKGYRGYVVNVSETCDAENRFQWVTEVQVAPNAMDDSRLLAEALSGLKSRTGVKRLVTDGAYASSDNDALLAEYGVTLIPTGIRGRSVEGRRFHLSDFTIERGEDGQPQRIYCAMGAVGEVQLSRGGKSWLGVFAHSCCSGCAARSECPVELRPRRGDFRLRFTEAQLHRAQRGRVMLQFSGKNLRVAIGSTIRSVKHSFRGGKAPVRGLFRVYSMVIGSAALVNVRRIHRWLQDGGCRHVVEEALQTVGICFGEWLKRLVFGVLYVFGHRVYAFRRLARLA